MNTKMWQRILAGVTAVTFLCTSTAPAAVTNLRGRVGSHRSVFAGKNAATLEAFKELLPSELADIYIPTTLGHVEERFVGSDPRFVLITQDIHANYEAQNNIAGIMQFLQTGKTRGNFPLMALEGGDAEVDPFLFKAMDDEAIRSQLIDYFIKEGSITGAERYLIETKVPAKGIGVEEADAYMQNLQHFRKSYEQKEGIRKDVQVISNFLSKLKPLVFTEELKEMNQKGHEFNENKIKFTDYCAFLKDMAQKHGVNIQGHKNFNLVVQMTEMEKTYDKDKVQDEKAKMIEAIQAKAVKEDAKALLEKVLLFKLGKISNTDFYGFVLDMAHKCQIDSKDYPNLVKFAESTKLFDQINVGEVSKECERISLAIRETMYKNPEQRDLDQLDTHVATMNRLLDLSLTREELAWYESCRGAWAGEAIANFLQKMSKNYGIPIEVTDDIKTITERFLEMHGFYEAAKKRDEIMLNKTLAAMDSEKKKTAVLVVGGFHSKGVSEKLRGKGISYAVVTPRFMQDDSEKVYLSQMLNEETPFARFLARRGSRLAPMLLFLNQMSKLAKDPANAEKIKSTFALAEILYAGLLAGGTESDVMAARMFRNAVDAMMKGFHNASAIEVKIIVKNEDGSKTFELAVDGKLIAVRVGKEMLLNNIKASDVLMRASVGDKQIAMTSLAQAATELAQAGKFDADAELAKLGIGVSTPTTTDIALAQAKEAREFNEAQAKRFQELPEAEARGDVTDVAAGQAYGGTDIGGLFGEEGAAANGDAVQEKELDAKYAARQEELVAKLQQTFKASLEKLPVSVRTGLAMPNAADVLEGMAQRAPPGQALPTAVQQVQAIIQALRSNGQFDQARDLAEAIQKQSVIASNTFGADKQQAFRDSLKNLIQEEFAAAGIPIDFESPLIQKSTQYFIDAVTGRLEGYEKGQDVAYHNPDHIFDVIRGSMREQVAIIARLQEGLPEGYRLTSEDIARALERTLGGGNLHDFMYNAAGITRTLRMEDGTEIPVETGSLKFQHEIESMNVLWGNPDKAGVTDVVEARLAQRGLVRDSAEWNRERARLLNLEIGIMNLGIDATQMEMFGGLDAQKKRADSVIALATKALNHMAKNGLQATSLNALKEAGVIDPSEFDTLLNAITNPTKSAEARNAEKAFMASSDATAADFKALLAGGAAAIAMPRADISYTSKEHVIPAVLGFAHELDHDIQALQASVDRLAAEKAKGGRTAADIEMLDKEIAALNKEIGSVKVTRAPTMVQMMINTFGFIEDIVLGEGKVIPAFENGKPKMVDGQMVMAFKGQGRLHANKYGGLESAENIKAFGQIRAAFAALRPIGKKVFNDGQIATPAELKLFEDALRSLDAENSLITLLMDQLTTKNEANRVAIVVASQKQMKDKAISAIDALIAAIKDANVDPAVVFNMNEHAAELDRQLEQVRPPRLGGTGNAYQDNGEWGFGNALNRGLTALKRSVAANEYEKAGYEYRVQEITALLAEIKAELATTPTTQAAIGRHTDLIFLANILARTGNDTVQDIRVTQAVADQKDQEKLDRIQGFQPAVAMGVTSHVIGDLGHFSEERAREILRVARANKEANNSAFRKAVYRLGVSVSAANILINKLKDRGIVLGGSVDEIFFTDAAAKSGVVSVEEGGQAQIVMSLGYALKLAAAGDGAFDAVSADIANHENTELARLQEPGMDPNNAHRYGVASESGERIKFDLLLLAEMGDRQTLEALKPFSSEYEREIRGFGLEAAAAEKLLALAQSVPMLRDEALKRIGQPAAAGKEAAKTLSMEEQKVASYTQMLQGMAQQIKDAIARLKDIETTDAMASKSWDEALKTLAMYRETVQKQEDLAQRHGIATARIAAADDLDTALQNAFASRNLPGQKTPATAHAPDQKAPETAAAKETAAATPQEQVAIMLRTQRLLATKIEDLLAEPNGKNLQEARQLLSRYSAQEAQIMKLAQQQGVVADIERSAANLAAKIAMVSSPSTAEISRPEGVINAQSAVPQQRVMGPAAAAAKHQDQLKNLNSLAAPVERLMREYFAEAQKAEALQKFLTSYSQQEEQMRQFAKDNGIAVDEAKFTPLGVFTAWMEMPGDSKANANAVYAVHKAIEAREAAREAARAEARDAAEAVRPTGLWAEVKDGLFDILSTPLLSRRTAAQVGVLFFALAIPAFAAGAPAVASAVAVSAGIALPPAALISGLGLLALLSPGARDVLGGIASFIGGIFGAVIAASIQIPGTGAQLAKEAFTAALSRRALKAAAKQLKTLSSRDYVPRASRDVLIGQMAALNREALLKGSDALKALNVAMGKFLLAQSKRGKELETFYGPAYEEIVALRTEAAVVKGQGLTGRFGRYATQAVVGIFALLAPQMASASTVGASAALASGGLLFPALLGAAAIGAGYYAMNRGAVRAKLTEAQEESLLRAYQTLAGMPGAAALETYVNKMAEAMGKDPRLVLIAVADEFQRLPASVAKAHRGLSEQDDIAGARTKDINVYQVALLRAMLNVMAGMAMKEFKGNKLQDWGDWGQDIARMDAARAGMTSRYSEKQLPAYYTGTLEAVYRSPDASLNQFSFIRALNAFTSLSELLGKKLDVAPLDIAKLDAAAQEGVTGAISPEVTVARTQVTFSDQSLGAMGAANAGTDVKTTVSGYSADLRNEALLGEISTALDVGTKQLESRDLGDLLKAAEAMSEQERRFNVVFERFADTGVFTARYDEVKGKLNALQARLKEALAKAKAEILGRKINELYPVFAGVEAGDLEKLSDAEYQAEYKRRLSGLPAATIISVWNTHGSSKQQEAENVTDALLQQSQVAQQMDGVDQLEKLARGEITVDNVILNEKAVGTIDLVAAAKRLQDQPEVLQALRDRLKAFRALQKIKYPNSFRIAFVLPEEMPAQFQALLKELQEDRDITVEEDSIRTNYKGRSVRSFSGLVSVLNSKLDGWGLTAANVSLFTTQEALLSDWDATAISGAIAAILTADGSVKIAMNNEALAAILGPGFHAIKTDRGEIQVYSQEDTNFDTTFESLRAAAKKA